MKPLWKIRSLAIGLVVFFGFGTFLAARDIFTNGSEPHLLFAVVTNLGFVGGAIGLLSLKRWSWWLTIALCAVSILFFLWQIFTTLTAESATKQNEIISYIVVGFYLGIAFLLTSDSSRKCFREANGKAHTDA